MLHAKEDHAYPCGFRRCLGPASAAPRPGMRGCSATLCLRNVGVAGGPCRRYRKYSYSSLRDLLRVIRNKHNHFREMPEELQRRVGHIPDGFLRCAPRSATAAEQAGAPGGAATELPFPTSRMLLALWEQRAAAWTPQIMHLRVPMRALSELRAALLCPCPCLSVFLSVLRAALLRPCACLSACLPVCVTYTLLSCVHAHVGLSVAFGARYFMTRFPRLLLACYSFALQHCSAEATFRPFFPSATKELAASMAAAPARQTDAGPPPAPSDLSRFASTYEVKVGRGAAFAWLPPPPPLPPRHDRSCVRWPNGGTLLGVARLGKGTLIQLSLVWKGGRKA
jgi:Ribonuclease 2-5A